MECCRPYNRQDHQGISCDGSNGKNCVQDTSCDVSCWELFVQLNPIFHLRAKEFGHFSIRQANNGVLKEIVAHTPPHYLLVVTDIKVTFVVLRQTMYGCFC